MFCNFFDREIARFVLRPKVDWAGPKWVGLLLKVRGRGPLGPLFRHHRDQAEFWTTLHGRLSLQKFRWSTCKGWKHGSI